MLLPKSCVLLKSLRFCKTNFVSGRDSGSVLKNYIFQKILHSEEILEFKAKFCAAQEIEGKDAGPDRWYHQECRYFLEVGEVTDISYEIKSLVNYGLNKPTVLVKSLFKLVSGALILRSQQLWLFYSLFEWVVNLEMFEMGNAALFLDLAIVLSTVHDFKRLCE